MIDVKRAGRVAEVAIQNPPVNIIDMKTLEELTASFSELARDEGVAACLLSGVGKCFSAGASVEDHREEWADRMLTVLLECCKALSRLPFPTVALVHGACLGGALELVSFCDYVVADPSARFGLPEISLAFFPPFACSVLPQIVGRQNSAYLIFSGETVDSEAALRMGLVQKILGREEWGKVSDHYNGVSLPVARLAKKAFLLSARPYREESLGAMKSLFLERLYSFEDVKEGITSFKEKRKPQWSHR